MKQCVRCGSWILQRGCNVEDRLQRADKMGDTHSLTVLTLYPIVLLVYMIVDTWILVTSSYY